MHPSLLFPQFLGHPAYSLESFSKLSSNRRPRGPRARAKVRRREIIACHRISAASFELSSRLAPLRDAEYSGPRAEPKIAVRALRHSVDTEMGESRPSEMLAVEACQTVVGGNP